jgi:dihydroorotate dehydrogenase (fumarate)
VIEEAKRHVAVPLIGSLNGTSVGGWIKYAQLMESAGVDALELNMYLIAANEQDSSDVIERRYLELVEEIRQSIEIPLAVKVGPFFTAFANMAWRFIEAGANGLVLFNRFYQPDIDPETLEVRRRLMLSDSEESRLILRWIAILRNRIPGSLAATTGIHTPEDVVKALLAGADVTMMASALIRNGVGHLGLVEEGLVHWLRDHDYTSVEEMRGSMSQDAVEDPSAFERMNYMQTIVSYSSKLRSWQSR